MARQEGLEPPTYCLEGSCSIQLSYWRMYRMERVTGIGPAYPAWKAGVLPLNYTRRSLALELFSPIILAHLSSLVKQKDKKTFAGAEPPAPQSILLSTHSFQLVQHLPEIFRQRGEYHHRPAVPGVGEAQGSGVEDLGALPQLRLFAAVDRIA